MSNTKTWPDPDAANAATGPSVGAVYLLDPTTQKPINPATSSAAPVADTVATGTLSAAQATVGTPVVGGTVSITLGAGQATVEAAFTGTFNAGTTVLFEGTEDSGVTTNWFSMFGQDTSVQNPTNISSIVGGASKLIRIPSMGYTQVRVRATPFAGGDSVAVRLVASVAGSGGSGGAVTVTNANANGQATMANSAPVVVASDQSKLPVKAASGDFPAGTITDLATLAAIVSSNKAAVKAASGDFAAGSLADGAITTLGLEADAAAAADTSTASYISLFKRLLAKFPTIGPQAKSASVSVTFATDNPKAGVTAASGDFADGAINTLGAQADAAYTDATGAASGTSQGLFKGMFVKLAAIATSVAGVLQVKRSAVAVYSLASTATTSSSNSGDLTVGAYTEISLDINTTAQTGTNPTIQFTYSRKGADGIYYALWQSGVLTVAANTLSTSIGAGMAYNQSLGSTGQLKWVIGGTATPGFTFSANISGK